MVDCVNQLQSLAEPAYQEMMQRLIPNVPPECVLGVRFPVLRKFARQMAQPEAFLDQLPHRYLEENLLHVFLLEGEKDFASLVFQVERFLPYIDNWAVCDALRPKAFAKEKARLLPYIKTWIVSDRPYTARFAVEMLMCHYLKEDFSPEYLELVAAVRMEHYYVKMMVAWYFATALTEQYQAALPYLTQERLDTWTHNKSIQKAVESHCILPEQKACLRRLRRRQPKSGIRL